MAGGSYFLFITWLIWAPKILQKCAKVSKDVSKDGGLSLQLMCKFWPISLILLHSQEVLNSILLASVAPAISPIVYWCGVVSYGQ